MAGLHFLPYLHFSQGFLVFCAADFFRVYSTIRLGDRFLCEPYTWMTNSPPTLTRHYKIFVSLRIF